MTAADRFDAAIVGGGPAGLSAALLLGRCRRRVVVCDAGAPRNAASAATHGFFTRDGEEPRALLRIGREQLAPYDVAYLEDTVSRIRGRAGRFTLRLASGGVLVARSVLLATGLVDELPPVPGVEELYGRSVFHCPYCDGWELRDRPLAAYGSGAKGTEYALALRNWSDDLVLCTDGGRLSARQGERLARSGIRVRKEPIAKLEGADGVLEHVVFESGEPLARRALFFSLGTAQRSGLPAELGVKFNRKGEVRTDRSSASTVPGVFVAGDASYDVNLIATAVAEGTKAAMAMHRSLRR